MRFLTLAVEVAASLLAYLSSANKVFIQYTVGFQVNLTAGPTVAKMSSCRFT